LGWFRASWAGWFPGTAQVGYRLFPFIFFFLFSFSFVSDFYFGFLKKLFYSDLNKSKADYFCSSKGVFKTYKPKV
jgi:hypothetical protein